MKKTTKKQALERIKRWKTGKVFSSADFEHLGTPANLRQALRRLGSEGVIRRVGWGLYERPRVSPELGELSTDMAEVAKAVARQQGFPVQISGAAAANALGLSTQVPAQLVYLTPGHSRRVRVGNRSIEFRHVDPRRFYVAPGTSAGNGFHALLHLGPGGVTEEVINTLRARLRENDKELLARHARLGPEWVQSAVSRMCERAPIQAA